MSEKQTKSSFGKVWWLLGIVVFAAVVVYFLTREHYTNEMLSGIHPKLKDHALTWDGRGPDFVQYTMTLTDERDSTYAATYRIPALTTPMPGLIVLHDFGNADSLFDVLREVPRSAQCAILGINVGQFFNYNAHGEPEVDNKHLGRALLPGIRAADLALQFIEGHRIIDTSAIYLIGVSEGSLIALPAAANYGNELAGLACLRGEKLMELNDWQPDEFGSPIGWAKQVKLDNVLVVNSGEQDSKRTGKFAAAFEGGAGHVQRVAGDPRVKSLETTVNWILEGRAPVEPIKSVSPPDPTKDRVMTVKG